MSRIPCSSCGKPTEPVARYCLFCGAALSPSDGETTKDPVNPVPDLPYTRSTAPYLLKLDAQKLSTAWGRLIRLNSDGSNGASFPLVGSSVQIGRRAADLCFPNDKTLADVEFELTHDGKAPRLVPSEMSLNGTFVGIRTATNLVEGDQIRVGQQLFTFEFRTPVTTTGTTIPLGKAPGQKYWGRLRQRVGPTLDANVFLLDKPQVQIGRNTGDIVVEDDPFLSSQHAQIRWDGEACILDDLKSSNGTFLRMSNSVVLNNDDRFLVGQHVFKFHL